MPLFLVLPQSPFKDVTLQVIGDGASASFFEVNDQGQVKLKTNANLTTDNGLTYFVSQLIRLSVFSSLEISFVLLKATVYACRVYYMLTHYIFIL